MKQYKYRFTWVMTLFLVIMLVQPSYAAQVPRSETPDYRIGFYAFDNYHMQDADGRRYGYGYEMMQSVANYMQCTLLGMTKPHRSVRKCCATEKLTF